MATSPEFAVSSKSKDASYEMWSGRNGRWLLVRSVAEGRRRVVLANFEPPGSDRDTVVIRGDWGCGDKGSGGSHKCNENGRVHGDGQIEEN